MMKTLKRKLERLLPFLSQSRMTVPRHEGKLGGGRIPPGTLAADARYVEIEVRDSKIADRSLAQSRFYRSFFDKTVFNNVGMDETCVTHSLFRDCQLDHCSLEGSAWSVIEGEGTHFEHCNFGGAQWTGVSLRDTVFNICDWSGATFSLSDFFGARLSSVKAAGARFVGVDFSYTTLEEVDFSGADLQGCSLAYVFFRDVSFEGAFVKDTDFRGARGLTRAARADLHKRGARLWSGWIEATLGKVLPRLRPSWDAEAVDTWARRGGFSAKLGLFLLVCLLTVHLFQMGIMKPPAHGSGADAAVAVAPEKRTATAEEIAQTRANLERLRAAIKKAYETTGRYGVARYPKEEELAGNQFDRDGDGPGTEMVPLVEGGLPLNFLTEGEGIAPYCNEVPTQGTLSGDNTDWHYCDANGQIFACGGFTDLPTVTW